MTRAVRAPRGKVAYLEAFGHRDREAADPMETDDVKCPSMPS